MRSKVVFVVLLLMFAGFVASILLRSREPVTAFTDAPPSASSMGSVASSATLSPSVGSSSAAAPSGSAAQVKEKLMTRPLRVAALGWDLIAPGALVNQGLSPHADSVFTEAGLDVDLAPFDSVKKLEDALARGGSDENGADVAILPMPAYVAAYERLRALDPRVFFVVGWSKGREALYSKEASLTNIPTGKLTLLAQPGTSSALLGHFLLDLAGVSPGQLTVWDSPSDKKTPTFESVVLSERASPDPSRGTLLLTTADVPRLVPLVAIAQGGFVEKHTEALAVWARTWLEGEDRIRTDAAASARTIAKYPGAPDPLVLINRLGPIGWATLADNARWAGLSGRGAVTLETLFQRTWRLWREAGLLSTPLPETPCTAPNVITALVRQTGVSDSPKVAAKRADGDKGQERVLVVHVVPGTKIDEISFVNEIGILAGLFELSEIRVSVRGPRGRADAARLVRDAEGMFGIEASRLRASPTPSPRGAGMIEVLLPK